MKEGIFVSCHTALLNKTYMPFPTQNKGFTSILYGSIIERRDEAVWGEDVIVYKACSKNSGSSI
jgi:hypothetical protein